MCCIYINGYCVFHNFSPNMANTKGANNVALLFHQPKSPRQRALNIRSGENKRAVATFFPGLFMIACVDDGSSFGSKES